jgi:hypothetical protein
MSKTNAALPNKKDVRLEVTNTLTTSLNHLKELWGEKKFNSKIADAAKLLTKGLKAEEPKKEKEAPKKEKAISKKEATAPKKEKAVPKKEKAAPKKEKVVAAKKNAGQKTMVATPAPTPVEATDKAVAAPQKATKKSTTTKAK